MYIDKTWFQRGVFLTVTLIFGMAMAMVFHECEIPEIPEPEPKVVVKTVYIIIEGKKEPEKVEAVTYYDVPLSEELQDHIFKLCEERGVDPALVMGMIKKESSFNPDSIGDSGNAYGLMQIWPKWHGPRMKQYNCPDLLDPFQNVTVGIDIIADWLDTGRGVEYALMGYNGGNPYAKNMWSAGKVSEYAQKVLEYAEGYGYEG